MMHVEREKLEGFAQYVAEGASLYARYVSCMSTHDHTCTGKVKPVVDSVFAFEDALKAYERIMSQRALGKVVVKVDPEAD